MSPDWFVHRKCWATKEPDEGNLHVRVCGEGAGQPVPLPGRPTLYALSVCINVRTSHFIMQPAIAYSAADGGVQAVEKLQ